MACSDSRPLAAFSIFDHLHRHGVPLRNAARLDNGMALALWERDETVFTRYEDPGHHTLSLYVNGGTQIRRRMRGERLSGGGSGTLCLMPSGISTDWDVAGPLQMLHLYISHTAFEHVAHEALDTHPDQLALRDLTFFRDAYLENAIRATLLPLDWQAPADRMVMSSAGHTVLTYLAARYTDRRPAPVSIRGGLKPALLRRLADYVDARLGEAITLDDLASEAAMSPYHFARLFKHATGETPHAFVLRQRIAHARRLLAEGRHDLAEIALLCGFSGQSHFTARFRRATGMTPRQYANAAAV